MNTRNIVFIILVVLTLGGGYWLFSRDDTPTVADIPLPTPTIEEKVEGVFDIQIPDGVDKAELRDISGGNAGAIATRLFENNFFEHTILADLPDLEGDFYYQAWLSNGIMFRPTGMLRVAKGGYLLEYNTNEDLTSYSSVIISEEDSPVSAPGKIVLEGEF